MIEVTVHDREGVKFYEYCLIEPFRRENGVIVEHIRASLMGRPHIQQMITDLGLVYVGHDVVTDSEIYTLSELALRFYRTRERLFRVYWSAIRFLYYNARMFQQVPEGERFSWRYFTPYAWLRALKRWRH